MLKKKYVYFILCLVLFGCNDNLKFIDEYMSIHSDINKRKIIFPQNLYLYNNVNSQNINSKSKKIIITGDISCPICLKVLNEIEIFIQKNQEIQCFYIGHGDTSNYFRYQVDVNNYTFPIFYDQNSNFISDNLLYTSNESIFLVDKNKRIVFTGSPFEDEIIYNYYLKIFAKP
jgi:hypothetical protein